MTYLNYLVQGNLTDEELSPRCCVQAISDRYLPEEFQVANMYRGGLTDEKVARFKQWCTDNRVYYYARPAEKFFESEAYELAWAAGCDKLIMENMS